MSWKMSTHRKNPTTIICPVNKKQSIHKNFACRTFNALCKAWTKLLYKYESYEIV